MKIIKTILIIGLLFFAKDTFATVSLQNSYTNNLLFQTTGESVALELYSFVDNEYQGGVDFPYNGLDEWELTPSGYFSGGFYWLTFPIGQECQDNYIVCSQSPNIIQSGQGVVGSGNPMKIGVNQSTGGTLGVFFGSIEKYAVFLLYFISALIAVMLAYLVFRWGWRKIKGSVS